MKYTSCNWITHGMNFEPGHIEICCLRCHIGGGNLFVKLGYNGESLDWNEFFDLKKVFIEENKNGKINPKCEGCFNFSNIEWNDEKYINYIHFNHWTHCNCNCIYCYTTFDKKSFNTKRYYNVYPIVKDLVDKNLFRPDGEITFAGGEPTMLEEFDDLLNLFVEQKERNIIVHSSGIKYSPALAKAINVGCANVVLSFDSGCRETYKKIKNVDGFDRLVESAKLYAQAENPINIPLVATKFILLPEINDNIEEAEKWLKITSDCGVRRIVIDIEHEWFCLQRAQAAFPKHGREVLDYIQNRAKELNLQIILYNSARYFLENLKDFPNYEFIPYHYYSYGQNNEC